MAVTDHYDFWYIDPDEEISDFPSTWNFNIDDIDAAIHAAATDPVAVSRVPNLPASKTTSGKFAQARIPNLPASQINTGEFADARIPNSIARTADVDTANSDLDKRVTDNADRLDNHGEKIGTLETNVSDHGDQLDDLAALKDRIKELEEANRSTGTRNIDSLLQSESGFVSDRFKAQLIRSGPNVTVVFSSLMREESGSGWTDVVILPKGFRPIGNLYTVTNRSTWVGMTKSGHAQAYNPQRSLDYFYFTYVTNDPWPSTLPGDPA